MIVACWKGNDATLDLLLERLPNEEIRRPGPDGLKPITILAKLGKWATIKKFQDKFGDADFTDTHIANNKQDLFESRLEGSEPESWVVESAYKSNAAWAIDQMRIKYGKKKVDDTISSQWESPYVLMREATGQSSNREESFLTKLTKRYPVFNEKTEEKPIYQLPKSKTLSVEKDILVHAKEQFCSLKPGNGQTSVFNIGDMNFQEPLNCVHG